MHNIIVRFASFPPQLKQINQDHIKISSIEENAQCLRAKRRVTHNITSFNCILLSRSLRRCFRILSDVYWPVKGIKKLFRSVRKVFQR